MNKYKYCRYIFLIIGCFAIYSCELGDASLQNAIDYKTIRFNVLVDTSNPMTNEPQCIEKDWGVLLIPKTIYSNKDSLRLIILCHGGGGTVNDHTSQIEQLPLTSYLLSKGFAVMDMSGMPITYSKRKEIDHYRTLGSYIAIRSYIAGYKYVVDNYRIKKDGIIIMGGSNGGVISTNIVLHTNIPTLAQIGFSPLINLIDNAWNMPTGAINGGQFNAYQNRANMIRIYGMKDISTQEELNNAQYEIDKVGKHDPVTYLKENPEIGYPIPFLLINPKNDGTILIKFAQEFSEMMRQRNNNIILDILDGGGHDPLSYGKIIKTIYYGGQEIEVNETMEKILQFSLKYK